MMMMVMMISIMERMVRNDDVDPGPPQRTQSLGRSSSGPKNVCSHMKRMRGMVMVMIMAITMLVMIHVLLREPGSWYVIL